MAKKSKPSATNSLYYGDNLDILRRYIPDESVDLVYLDPPFNSNQDYNVLFKARDGEQSSAQIKAFTDTWHWSAEAAVQYEEIIQAGGPEARAMEAFWQVLGPSDMLAYLCMMAPRIIELRRVLSARGSLYLHCDSTASHYLKILLDAIFGSDCYRNEIIWKRTSAHSDSKQGRKQFGKVHDTLLFYSRTDKWHWETQYADYDEDYIRTKYRHADEDGRLYRLDNLTGPGGAGKGNAFYELMGVERHWRYSKENMQKLVAEGRIVQTKPGNVPQYKRFLDEMPGVPMQDLWTDISPINSQAAERLGYPTQKPLELIERIMAASCPAGGVFLDPFCGCGTSIEAAQKQNRKWIGIDITFMATNLIKYRLEQAFGSNTDYEVRGEPTTLDEAQHLAAQDPYQFQWWSLGLVKARPADEKKGADKGIDGCLYFQDEKPGTAKSKQVIFSVKAGKPAVSHLRDLRGVLDREKAEIGVLITMQPPTSIRDLRGVLDRETG